MRPKPCSDAGWQKWIPWLILAAGFAVYQNSFGVPFLMDGRIYIEGDKSLHQLWPLTDVMAGSSRPLTRLTFALNYALGRLHVPGYHGVNLAIHLAAALVLFRLIIRTFASPRLTGAQSQSSAASIAGATALLWVVHPLQTQSVTYIYERAESLMSLFYLLALYAAARSLRGGARSGRWQAAACAACAAGMASKAVMVSAPLMVLLYDRIFWAGSWKEIWARRRIFYLALAATWLILAAIAAMPHESRGTIGADLKTLTPLAYAAKQPRAILHYLQQALWPNRLILDYGRLALRSGPEMVLPWLCLSGLGAATLWAIRRRPALGFLGIWFFLTLAPTSSFFPIADAVVEHRMYLALAAVVLAAVLAGKSAIEWAVAGRSARAVCMTLSLAVAAAGLGAATISRNEIYRDRAAIWKDVIAKRPRNPHAYSHLASAMIDRGKGDEAIRYYRKALEIGKPSTWVRGRRGPSHAYLNLGTLYAQKGDSRRAIASLHKALESRPDFPAAQRNLAIILAGEGRFEEAAGTLEQAIQNHPENASLWFRLGRVYQKWGEADQAIRCYRESVRLEPDSIRTRNNLAIALAGRGLNEKALKHLEIAHRLAPENKEVLMNLRMVESQLGAAGS